ncbi:probable insulin-like peptide 3 [Stomoxys calcitrans]|uniref:Insulin-like domain-containing protein n=1 Tax=Stomoxys calcitrans TaxID=35570 RepID=A0A1I8PLE9_STOCA|nr:probable insulin-like peptide 3 [Stomoxys calcitrans]
MKLLSILVIFAVLYESHGEGSRFCGPNLAQILEMVCYNGYNGMIMNKKSGNKVVHHDMDILNKFNEINDESPFNSDSLLNDLLYGNHVQALAKTRRQRHLTGVYDECCRKSCTMEELTGYCL